MKKFVPSIIMCLSLCLFIYVFYRTEKTLVNYVAVALLSKGGYEGIKEIIISVLPLKDAIVYSLPEGLWVFCITITSSFFYIRVRRRRYGLTMIPILLAIGMEVFQLLGISNGRFDYMDILLSAAFWLLAVYITRNNPDKEPIFQPLNARVIFCASNYAIVYMAHVCY